MIIDNEKKVYIILLILIIIAILIVSNLSLFLHKKYKYKNSNKPTFQVQEVNVKGTTKSGEHYVLHASSAKELLQNKEYKLDQVHTIIYWDPNNKHPSYILDSTQAHFFSNQNQLFFPESVTLTSYKRTGTKNHTLNTSQAYFNIKNHLLTSNGPTKDTTNNYIGTSTKGIQTFDQNKKIFFLGYTKIQMNNGAVLTSDKYFYINKEKNFYFATKNSTFSQKTIHFTSKQYLSAVLKKNIIEKIFAKNQVSISNQEILAKGNSLLYQKKLKKITLWGDNKNFGFFDKLESIPKTNSKFAYLTQKNIKFTANSFVAYLKKRNNTWVIDHIKAFGHVSATNHKGVTVTGKVGYYNTITKKLMICGHASSFSKKFILHGSCIMSNLQSGISRVIHTKHSNNQVKMLIFK